MQKNNVPIEFDSFCFSIVTEKRYYFLKNSKFLFKKKKRSLDLKANDIKLRVKWTKFLKYYLVNLRDKRMKVKIIFNFKNIIIF